MATDAPPLSSEAVQALRAELSRIVGSPQFARSRRLSRFLVTITELAVAGRQAEIKESRIAMDVFERDASFDTAVNTIVRVEAGRLRHKLLEYYETQASEPAVRIDVPKGTYVPVFTFREDRPTASPKSAWTWRRAALCAATAACIFLAAFAVLAMRAHPREPDTRVPEARVLYLKGRKLWNIRTDLQASIEFYRRALALDPKYAAAYAGLAESYAVLIANGDTEALKRLSEAHAAAKIAMHLDPTLAAPHAALGLLSSCCDTNGWAAAEREFRAATRLDPTYATAFQWYGHALMGLGRFREALAQLQHAQELDPLSSMISTNIGDVYFYSHQYDQALEQYRKALETQPSFLAAHIGIQQVEIVQKRYREALDDIDRWIPVYPNEGSLRAERAVCLAHLGLAVDSVSLPPEHYLRAYVFAALGKADRAVDELESVRPYLVRSAVGYDPLLDALHANPRFVRLLESIHVRTES